MDNDTIRWTVRALHLLARRMSGPENTGLRNAAMRTPRRAAGLRA